MSDPVNVVNGIFEPPSNTYLFFMNTEKSGDCTQIIFYHSNQKDGPFEELVTYPGILTVGSDIFICTMHIKHKKIH